MAPNSRGCHPDRRGFTLVELLVTISIIVVLAALAFLAFRRAKRSAMQATDLGRIRQLTMACQSFASEQGHFPDSFQYARVTWDVQLFPYIGQEEVYARPSEGVTDMSEAGLEVFQAVWDKAPRKPGGIRRGFAMAGWICNAIEGPPGKPGPYTAAWGVTWPNHRGAPLAAIKRPVDYILLTPIGRKFQNPLNVIGAGSYALSDWPGDNEDDWPYDGSAAFAFCDGSVRVLKRRDFESQTDYRERHADNNP